MNEHSVIFNGLISENIYRKLASCYNQHLCFFPSVSFPSTSSEKQLKQLTYLELEAVWGSTDIVTAAPHELMEMLRGSRWWIVVFQRSSCIGAMESLRMLG